MSTKQISGAALSAKAIKKRLAVLYPGVKFSVTSDIFSMGDSVSIGWTDGPLTDDVERITKQYQHGDFDGMEDIYNYCEIDPSLGCPGAKYVQCSRSMSHEYREKILAKAYEHYSDFEPNDNSAYRKMNETEKMFFPYPVAVVNVDSAECKDGSFISCLDYEVIKDVDTRDDSEIFVVKVITKVDDFKSLNKEMHVLGGYYSKFKKGFIFKVDPTERLKGKTNKEEGNTTMDTDNDVDTQESNALLNVGAEVDEKCNAAEITAANRFMPDDICFCKEQEEAYKEAHGFFVDILAKAQTFCNKYEKSASISEEYISKYGGKNIPGLLQYRNSIAETTQKFMDIICDHFRRKYNVSLETPKWNVINNENGTNQEKLFAEIVPLDYILESIHVQMGGMTFEEKALGEIISKMKQCVFDEYSQKWTMEITGAKLVVTGFYSSYKRSAYTEYEIATKEHNTAFFKALSHFEYNSAELHQKYSKFNARYTIREETGIYDRHTISSGVIRSIKVYKNGKVEFEFVDSKKARFFAKKYCGYTEQQSA